LACKAAPTLFTSIEVERGGLINRHIQGMIAAICRYTRVNGIRSEAISQIIHFVTSFLLLNGINQRLLHGFFGNFLTDARQFRNGQIALLIGAIIVFASIDKAFFQTIGMLFMDDKVGDRCLDMKRRRLGDRAAADVDLDFHIVYICHIADFLHLGNTATVANVRLNDIQCPAFKERTESKAAINTLARCHRNFDVRLDFPHRNGVEGVHRF
ncbi:Rubrerythrin diiron-binding domain-containing protein, partial [Dysosmobacter welbionis]